ncbi:MAG: biotin attachment protein, partial [Myxococcales bacterium]|nr:biotin attachment protein [Myxococcales bacterium]
MTCRPAEVPAVQAAAAQVPTLRMEIVVCHGAGAALAEQVDALAPRGPLPPAWQELCFLFVAADDRPRVRRYRADGSERPERRDILPTTSRRYDFKRLRDFDIERQPHEGEPVILKVTAKANPDDVRLLGYAEVRSLRRRPGRPLYLPDVDRVFHEAVRALEDARDRLGARRLQWNRLTLLLLPVVPLGPDVVKAYLGRLAPAADRLGLEKLVVRCRFATARGPGPWQDLSVANPSGHRPELSVAPATDEPLRPRSRYASKVVAARRRGLPYPYEIIRILEAGGDLPAGRFEEFDLDAGGLPVSVGGRPRGENRAGVVLGILRAASPQGPLERVLLLSDPTRAMGALSQPECERVVAALDLADRLGLPLEWVAVSAGARIDWDTGTENLDWTARVLRRIVTFTQAGGAIDVIVPGVCVGAQAYWNAEATMMMHTRGLLIMTDRGSMVLTGKRALDFSGCVSAEDDLALGGYTTIMGPNGQA